MRVLAEDFVQCARGGRGWRCVPDYHCFGRSEVWDYLGDLSLEVILIP